MDRRPPGAVPSDCRTGVAAKEEPVGVQGASSLARSGTDPARQGGWRARIPPAFAATLSVLAVLCAVAAVSEALNQRTQRVRMVVNVLVLPAPANLGYAALVAVLAGGVSRGKRVAYVFLLIYFGLQVAYDVLLLGLIATLAPGDWDSAPPPWYAPWEVGGNLLLTLGVLVVLYLARGQFYARVQRGSLRRALGVLAVLLTFCAALGWALVEAFPGNIDRDGRLPYALERVLGGAFAFHFNRRGFAPGWVNLLLWLFGGSALVIAVAVLLPSQRQGAALTPHAEERVRNLLAAYGERDTLRDSPHPRGELPGGDGLDHRAGRPVAGHRDRARLLDGAWPARRPGRRAVRPGRGAGPGGAGGGDPVVHAVGYRRALAGPDAPGPRVRQRADGVHGRRARRGGAEAGGRADLAELRGVPLGLRGGCPDRGGAGAAAVAQAAAVLLPLVPARVAVPVPRQVPARVGTPVPLLRGRPGPGPGGPPVRHRPGVRRRSPPS